MFVMLVGTQRFPRQQIDINATESVATAEEIHEESDAVCHNDEGQRPLSVDCVLNCSLFSS